jgi:hypothetical protein
MTTPNSPSAPALPKSELAQRLREVFSYNPKTGIFRWLNPPPRCRSKRGDRAGIGTSHGYRKLSFEAQQVLEHRAAWLMVHGTIDERLIDHINHDRADNRIDNLRLVDHAQNVWNKSLKHSIAYARPSSKGVRFESMIRHRGKRIFIGMFASKAEAEAAYQEKAKELRGEFHE